MKNKNNTLLARFYAHRTLYIFLLLSILFLFVLQMRWYDAWVGITADTKNIKPSVEEKISFQANIGVYDPEKSFASSTSIALEHVFVQWNVYSAFDTENDIKNIIHTKRWPLVTIEPFPRDGKDAGMVLSDVVSGEYDNTIKNLCGIFSKVKHPVFVRWGHEMEVVNGRYPWATNDFQSFISAYRHFVTSCRAEYKDIYFVWSPAGDRRLIQYWPGAEYVDYVGLSVYEYPLWDESYYGHIRTFQEIFSEKYAEVRIFEKPILIAEFGVTSSPQFQKEWLQDAYRVFNEYPLLKTVIYFNSKDHEGVWGKDVPTPDWRVDPQVFEK